MRVLYFHQYFATRASSNATRSYEIAKRLAARGHQVTVVSGDSQSAPTSVRSRRSPRHLVRRETIDGIDVLYLSLPYSNYFSVGQRLVSFFGFMIAATVAGLLQPRPDVVFATSTPLTIGVPGLAISRLARAPFVFEIRDLWPAVPVQLRVLTSRPLIRLAEWLETTLYRRARRVVVLSEGSRDALVARGVPPRKLVFAPNASDLDLFHPHNGDAGFRRERGLENHFIALYAGALGRANAPQQILDAAVLLRALGIERVHLVIAGDGAERPALQERIRRERLSNVTLLPPLPKTKLAGIMGAVDLTMTLFAPYPILSTNSPNKLFDSLAAGRPVLCNLDGWLRRVLEEGGAGMYVPAGDAAALAIALAAAAEEPAALRAMSINARRLAETTFDRDRVVARVVDALESVATHA